MIGLDKLGVILPIIVLIDPFEDHLAMSILRPFALAKTDA
jgi:hypothetical protein